MCYKMNSGKSAKISKLGKCCKIINDGRKKVDWIWTSSRGNNVLLPSPRKIKKKLFLCFLFHNCSKVRNAPIKLFFLVLFCLETSVQVSYLLRFICIPSPLHIHVTGVRIQIINFTKISFSMKQTMVVVYKQLYLQR